jgi:hypothetical protein
LSFHRFNQTRNETPTLNEALHSNVQLKEFPLIEIRQTEPNFYSKIAVKGNPNEEIEEINIFTSAYHITVKPNTENDHLLQKHIPKYC